MSKRITTTVNKSAVDGRFVSNKKVLADPKETYQQTVKKTVGKQGTGKNK
jgi:hypothetical protein